MKSFLRENLSLPSDGVVYANKPSAAMSRSRTDFISKLEQKMSNDTTSGIDKSGLDSKRCKNLA